MEIKFAGFEVLTTVVMNNTVFWNKTPYSLVDRDNVSEEPAASVFGIQTLVNIRLPWRHILNVFYSYHLASGHEIITSFLTWLAKSEGYLSAAFAMTNIAKRSTNSHQKNNHVVVIRRPY
jgi:hypothetical protein